MSNSHYLLLPLMLVACFSLDCLAQSNEEVTEAQCRDLLDSLSAISKPSYLHPPIDRYDLDFYYHGTNHDRLDEEPLYFDVDYTLQRNWIANQEIGYITFLPIVRSIGPYRIPLRETEGVTGPPDLIEAKVPVRYVVAQGRPSSLKPWSRMRLTFDYMPNFRMTLDSSKPLTPSDQRVGIGFDWAFWDNNKELPKAEKSSLAKYNTSITPITVKYLSSLSLSVLLHHYSNGQAMGFHYRTANGEERNDYRNGDFSTNYMKLGLTYGLNEMKTGRLLQASVYFRNDGQILPLLVFSDPQVRDYGKRRLEFRLDYRTKVHLFGKPIVHYQDADTFLIRRAFQHHFRLETTHILDANLSNFNPNLANWDGYNAYRTGIKAFYELTPLNHRNIGYLVMFYYGRDYLNIRYDNIVYAVQFGISFSLDKYFPTLYNTQDGVVAKVRKVRSNEMEKSIK